MIDNKEKLVIITGPTAVGKTGLSIELAKEINGEIISADSVQVYRHMDIGSAKIKKEEMQGIPHYLIDICEPTEGFSIAAFKEHCKKAMQEIYAKGKLPIIVGGTGFYIQSVIYDIDFKETDADNIREKYEELYREKGSEYLHMLLRKRDPESADIIHPNNVKRVIRALEYLEETGTRISTHNKTERAKTSPYNFAYFVLNCSRDKLYDRINHRVDIMLEEGLVDEVKKLVDTYGLDKNMVSMQALGYKEIYEYIKGNITLDEAVYTIKRDTRHFAKRQLTWFRREKEVIWVDKDLLTTEKEQLGYIKSELSAKNIL